MNEQNTYSDDENVLKEDDLKNVGRHSKQYLRNE